MNRRLLCPDFAAPLPPLSPGCPAAVPAGGVTAPSGGYPLGMTDLNPRVQQQAQVSIQAVVDAVTNEHSGQDPQLIRAALTDGLAAAGLPEQPEKWVADTADEIAGGRRLVVDRSLRDDDDPARRTPTQD
jgi:hypothetical protein